MSNIQDEASEEEQYIKIRHHPFVVPVITFLVLFFVTLGAYINFSGQTIGASDSHIVGVSINGKQETYPTRAQTVADLLDRIGVVLNEGDKVEPALDAQILEDNFQVNIYRSRPVTIIDGSKKIVRLSAEPTPRDVVKEAGLNPYPEDNIKLVQPNEILADGALGDKIVVERSIPIKLNLYGAAYEIRTRARTVNELMTEQNIKASEVSVFPSFATALKPGSVVFVTDPGKKIVVSEESIAPAEQIVDDYNLLFGQKVVREPGEPGKKVMVFDVAADGSKKLLQSVVIKEPVKRVIARGKKINTAAVSGNKASLMAAAGISPSDYSAADYVIGHESGWRPGAISRNGCYGLGQACPGSKLVNACSDWSNDPVCQLRFFSGYASRYGGWQGAQTFWSYNHWW
ncbi:MAG TPA: ubiquitin-like domain-containing protein [Patescibacteria group bacterium]|nr:ubiquitin-like domain-containing protein [Patescibacteria group bacterium]